MTDYDLDVIVPVYRNRDLTARCLDSLRANLGEIAAHHPRIIVVNDSPDDEQVSEYLERFEQGSDGVVLLTNKQNVGFVKTVNRALRMTIADRRAAVLVNSDTETFPGTLRNLLAAAESDPQIGFACPRSNNAALSTFPHSPHNLSGQAVCAEATHRHWESLRGYMPQVTYAPTAVGFYLYVKRELLQNFAPLNEEFELGYEEENDLIMRANKVGYRAVLANHAFAFHAGSASFLLRDLDIDERKSKNLAKMAKLHPEFLPLVRQYEASPEFRTERLLKNLIPSSDGKIRLLIDLNRMGPFNNGTSELAVNAITAILQEHGDKFEVAALCSQKSFKFHKLDRFPNLERVDTATPDYAVAVNLGQPFELHQINVLESAAPVNVYGMLDTIAHDCGHLTLDSDVSRYWHYVSEHANGVFFISDFSRLTFFNRFPRSTCPHYTRLLPTRVSLYAQEYAGVSRGERHILVLGNHFPHKASQDIGEQICTQLSSSTVAVMGTGKSTRPNMKAFRSGDVDASTMRELFAKASVVVLPSHYEGFGFGLMHALALGKPVVARDIPATREILRTFRDASGIYLFESNEDIVPMIREAVRAGRSGVDDALAADWNEWVAGLMELCAHLVRSPEVYAKCVARIRAGDALREYHLLKTASAAQAAAASQATRPASDASARRDLVPSEPAGVEITTVRQLMALDGEDFIRTAYWKLLKRPPDGDGMAHYGRRLASGIAKRDILADIAASPEGRRANSDLGGIEELLRRPFGHRLQKLLRVK